LNFNNYCYYSTLTNLKTHILLYLTLTALFLGMSNANAQRALKVVAKSADVTQTSATIAAPAGLHLKFAMDSTVYDEIGIYYSSAWSDKYDDNDSYDLDGFNPKVYLSSFTSDGVRVSINAWSNYTTTPARVKLYVRAVASGSYTISIEDFVNIDTSVYSINLVDNEQKDSIDMAKFNSYTFNLNVADTAAFDQRFVLAVEPKDVKPIPSYQLSLFDGSKASQGVQLNWQTLNAGINKMHFTLQKLNTTNGYDSLDNVQSDSANNYSYIDQHPIIGNNVYRLKQTPVSGLTSYSSPITIGYGTTTATTAMNVYPNPSKSFINVKLASNTTVGATYTAEIYNMSGSLVTHQSVTNGTFTQDISAYKFGVYFIQLKDNNGYLVGQSKFVKADQ